MEETISAALTFSRRSQDSAEDLLVLLHLQKDAIDFDILESKARKQGTAAALGFFLTLERHLTGNPNPSKAELRLKDTKPKKPEMLFFGSIGKLDDMLERRSPPAALEWGFRTYTPMSGFQERFNTSMKRHYCPDRREAHLEPVFNFSASVEPYGATRFRFVASDSDTKEDHEQMIGGRILLHLDKNGNLLSIEILDPDITRSLFGSLKPFTRKMKVQDISLSKDFPVAFIYLQAPFQGCSANSANISTAMIFDLNKKRELIGIEILHQSIVAALTRTLLRSGQMRKGGVVDRSKELRKKPGRWKRFLDACDGTI